MANAVSVLSTTVTADALWGQIATMAPLIGIMVIFAFGYHIYKRFISGTKGGKAKG